MTIHEEFQCKGYYGFGGGVELARHSKASPVHPSDHPLLKQGVYCTRKESGCPLSQECWDAHRERVKEMLPEMVAQLEVWEKEGLLGPALAKRMFDTYGVEPYTQVMLGNLEDGAEVELMGQPKDRDNWTLPYPFKERH